MRSSRQPTAGFTLTELVVVMVIASILSVYAIARINTLSFDAEGYANRVAAMVRYAQKLAISQRRTVAVVICQSTDTTTPCTSSDNRLALCYTNVSCGGGTVSEPPGTGAFAYKAPSGVALAGTNFTFDALGKPTPSGALNISATGETTRTITVEAETGYVH